jgi:uncharacterized protein (TIGR03435 family)
MPEIKNERYDITGTLAPGAAPDQVRPALQALLVEQFKLSIRRESKELPIYALTVAGGRAETARGSGRSFGRFGISTGSQSA